MPAQRLGTEAVRVLEFDVLGVDAANSPEFIRHVGLADREYPEVSVGTALAMVHMRPPLETGFASGPITSVGTAALTADEISQMRVFVDNLESEYTAAKARDARSQYCIAPHVRPYQSDGTLVCYQFNCGGFVIEAYRYTGIDLLETSEDTLPLIPLDVLTRQYPDYARALQKPLTRGRLGIAGDGPWPVVLAGYLLNALNRDESEIRSSPYRARAGDEFFLSRSSGLSSAST
jgi:hypothetical protein